MWLASAQVLLLALLPEFVGRGLWMVEGEVVSVTEGRGPAFVSRQQTAVVAAIGEAVELDCHVLRLGDKSVSWVRSRDLQILSHAGVVFTADSRVSASTNLEVGTVGDSAPGSHHLLRLERLRLSDAGRYECQVNTEPKLSLFFNLTVLEDPLPVAVVSVEGPKMREVAVGAKVTLACTARYEPPPTVQEAGLPPLQLLWLKDEELISLQNPRSGVSLDREVWSGGGAARLTLAALQPADGGKYVCRAATRVPHRNSKQAPRDEDFLQLVVLQPSADERLEWMQRDQATGAASERSRISLLYLDGYHCDVALIALILIVSNL